MQVKLSPNDGLKDKCDNECRRKKYANESYFSYFFISSISLILYISLFMEASLCLFFSDIGDLSVQDERFSDFVLLTSSHDMFYYWYQLFHI